MTHIEAKRKIEEALEKKFFEGSNADWGCAGILSFTGTKFTGLFLCDVNDLDGSETIVLMCRIQDPTTNKYVDTDIESFCTSTDDIDLFIEKIQFL